MSAASRRVLWLIAGCLWIAAIVAGMTLLAWHDSSAGIVEAAPRHWPRDSQIPLCGNGYTLVMFAHPRCPCTRASLGELENIVARCPGKAAAWVVFFKPSDTDETWDRTDQWFTAAEIPGVRAVRDIDGAEARRFSAITSGETLLYNSAGELLFSGGITFARGHAGDSAGRSAIESLLTNGMPQRRETPVFGCPIILTSERK